MQKKNKINWLLSKPIAHRGFHSNDNIVPENSLLAFQHAIKEQYPIELDVHLLADNKLVVFHDENLIRMCGQNIFIQDIRSDQLNSFRLLDSNQKIPLLQEVLHLVNGEVPILIEIKDQKKSNNIEKHLFDVISPYKGKIAIQSFNPFRLKWFAKNAPEIPRGQLSSNFKGEKMNFFLKKLLQYFLLNFASKPDFIAYDAEDMPNKTVENLRNKGLAVLCWTIRDQTAHKKVLPYCDNIIFERFKP